MEWYDLKANKITCGHCGWTGQGSDLKQGESFRDGAEFDCPDCGEKHSYVMWPKTTDMATDPRPPAIDKLHAEVILAQKKE